MPKSSITYAQVAEACQVLLGEGQKITLRTPVWSFQVMSPSRLMAEIFNGSIA